MRRKSIVLLLLYVIRKEKYQLIGGKRKKNRYVPKLTGHRELLNLGRRGEVQAMAPIAEAKCLCNSVKKIANVTAISARFAMFMRNV